MVRQSEARNISMMMDLYEMTMANGYFLQENKDTMVAFDVFYRRNPDGGGFSVFAGLEQILEYLEGLHFSEEDVAYLESLNLFGAEFLDYLRAFRFTGDVFAFRDQVLRERELFTAVQPVLAAFRDHRDEVGHADEFKDEAIGRGEDDVLIRTELAEAAVRLQCAI